MNRLRLLAGLLKLKLPAATLGALYGERLADVGGRRIDPRAQALCDLVAQLRDPAQVPTVAQSRAQLAMMVQKFDRPGPAGVRREEVSLPGGDGPRKARLFTPGGLPRHEPLPTLLYFHGGGWIQGSLDTHDPLCARLAAAGGFRVLSLDYRLAPEHRFPAAAEDALAAYLALARGDGPQGIAPDRLAVGGDSAGANLAAGLLHDLAKEGHPLPRAQLLIYPAVDSRLVSASVQALAENPILSRQRMRWYLEQYLPAGQDLHNPRLSPIFSDNLAGQPPALIVAAGHDPLWDDAHAYGDRLREAGVAVTVDPYPGQVHGFLSMTRLFRQGTEAARVAAGWLRHELAA